jgi:hypothetical protein
MIRSMLPVTMLLLLPLGGCHTGAAAADGEPAVLTEPDGRTRAELQRVVSEALGGVEVLLSDEALTDSSVLVIERRRHVDAAGRPIMGRDLGTPDRFLLIRQGGRCVLEHEGSGRRWPLDAARCVREAAESPPPG